MKLTAEIPQKTYEDLQRVARENELPIETILATPCCHRNVPGLYTSFRCFSSMATNEEAAPTP